MAGVAGSGLSAESTTDQLPAAPHHGESFTERKQPSDLLFQLETADAPARGIIIKDVNVGESLAERKYPSCLWFGTADAPARASSRGKIVKNVNGFINNHDCQGKDYCAVG